MALSDDRIAEMMRDTWGCASIAPRHAPKFARAIEAEVRKQDTALIRQLVEALEAIDDAMPFPAARQVLKVARARLESKHGIKGGQP